MKPVRILVDSFADEGLSNAQMANAREIILRLDPLRFHVSLFCLGKPDVRLAQRPNTRLIQLPHRRQTVRILREFISGDHRILFYLKSSPAAKWYLRLRRKWNDGRTTIGTIESQSDLRNEPTILSAAIQMWEQTVLRCDYLFSNSRAVQESLKSEYGLASEIVPTGVDTNFFTPMWEREANARPQVFFAGSLRPFKQPQVVLDAAARFPNAEFHLAGDGLMAEGLRERVKQTGLSNVAFLGLLRPDELKRHYQQADVFFFPSLWEGSPKVILEAAACGLPVIARNNYQPETVIDGQTGYLAGSDAELFSRLEELLIRPDLRQSLGRAGRKFSQRFDWDVVTRQWEEVFERLTSGKVSARAA